jgi:hypothetical protein
MKTCFKAMAFALVATLCVAGVASAQVYDTNGPNADLTINGQTASAVDPVNHDVTLFVPGTLVCQIETGVNADTPIILLGSILQPSPVVFPVPWGSLDLGAPGSPLPGAINLIADGLTPTRIIDFFARSDDGIPALGILPAYLLAVNAGQTLAGQSVALQSIVVDPTAPTAPGAPFDNTEVADVNFEIGSLLNAAPGDDGSVEVPFTNNRTFEFHGVSYTSVWVNGNGYLNFGGLTSVAASGFTNDNLSWLNAEPSIAPCMTDWGSGSPAAPGFGPGANTGVLVAQGLDSVTITYGDPSLGQMAHFVSNDLNTFSVFMELQDGSNPDQGNFSIIWNSFDTDATAQDYNNGLAGHTPGGAALLGGGFDLDMNDNGATGFLAAANVAQLEEHDATVEAATVIGYDGAGARRGYHAIQTNKTGRRVDFLALTTTVGGDNGYFGQGDGSTAGQPDDVSDWVGSNAFSDAGGEARDLGGVFFNFDTDASGDGTVVFDPAGLAIPAIITGIYDATGASGTLAIANPQPGPHRDGQGLQILTAPMVGLSGTVDVLVTFESGYMETIQAVINSAGTAFTSYSLGDDVNQTHVLAGGNSINWYGVNYTTLLIGSNGTLTFVNPSFSFGDSPAAAFAGWNGTLDATPGCSPMWMDINGSLGGSYDVLEDTVLLNTTVTFNTLTEFGQGAPMGTWSAQFEALGPNSVIFDWTGVTVAPVGGMTFGVSDGNSANGSNVNISDTFGTGLTTAIAGATSPGTYQSSVDSPAFVAPESIAELCPGGFVPSAINGTGVVNWIDGGGTGDWTIF